MRTSRTLITAVSLSVALLGASCRGDDSPESSATTTTGAAASVAVGPQNYTVIVDGPSTLGAENFVLGAYFPKTLSVRPGDTVVFDNQSSNDIHTVTFGVKSDRSDQPPIVTPDGQENPAVFKPCYASDGPQPSMKSCPPQAPGTPEFTGRGYWNSGVILPTSLPDAAGPKQATLKLDAATAPGPYTVVCLLHPFMQSTLQVVASDAERQTPDQVAGAADRELAQAKAAAAALTAPPLDQPPNGVAVAASWGDQAAAINRFSPETVTIKVGQTVTWRSLSSWMPHTVSFEPPFTNPSEPNALLPAGARSGARFDGGVSHSGIFGPKPYFPVETFALTFTKAGQYPYLCLLHPGMAGTVRVE